ncbi:MAG: hypothetical protein R2710_12580 [Acidimicrobiales bacterium]
MFDDDPDKVAELFAAARRVADVLADDGQLAVTFQIAQVPGESFLVDPSGVVVAQRATGGIKADDIIVHRSRERSPSGAVATALVAGVAALTASLRSTRRPRPPVNASNAWPTAYACPTCNGPNRRRVEPRRLPPSSVTSFA